ncbi:hypothetical protein HDU92_005308 [Lobulomyces angularis]|nr:hypothetical protein HDU92_005308 [Lobulomyces angularis]
MKKVYEISDKVTKFHISNDHLFTANRSSVFSFSLKNVSNSSQFSTSLNNDILQITAGQFDLNSDISSLAILTKDSLSFFSFDQCKFTIINELNILNAFDMILVEKNFDNKPTAIGSKSSISLICIQCFTGIFTLIENYAISFTFNLYNSIYPNPFCYVSEVDSFLFQSNERAIELFSFDSLKLEHVKPLQSLVLDDEITLIFSSVKLLSNNTSEAFLVLTGSYLYFLEVKSMEFLCQISLSSIPLCGYINTLYEQQSGEKILDTLLIGCCDRTIKIYKELILSWSIDLDYMPLQISTATFDGNPKMLAVLLDNGNFSISCLKIQTDDELLYFKELEEFEIQKLFSDHNDVDIEEPKAKTVKDNVADLSNKNNERGKTHLEETKCKTLGNQSASKLVNKSNLLKLNESIAALENEIHLKEKQIESNDYQDFRNIVKFKHEMYVYKDEEVKLEDFFITELKICTFIELDDQLLKDVCIYLEAPPLIEIEKTEYQINLLKSKETKDFFTKIFIKKSSPIPYSNEVKVIWIWKDSLKEIYHETDTVIELPLWTFGVFVPIKNDLDFKFQILLQTNGKDKSFEDIYCDCPNFVNFHENVDKNLIFKFFNKVDNFVKIVNLGGESCNYSIETDDLSLLWIFIKDFSFRLHSLFEKKENNSAEAFHIFFFDEIPNEEIFNYIKEYERTCITLEEIVINSSESLSYFNYFQSDFEVTSQEKISVFEEEKEHLDNNFVHETNSEGIKDDVELAELEEAFKKEMISEASSIEQEDLKLTNLSKFETILKNRLNNLNNLQTIHSKLLELKIAVFNFLRLYVELLRIKSIISKSNYEYIVRRIFNFSLHFTEEEDEMSIFKLENIKNFFTIFFNNLFLHYFNSDDISDDNNDEKEYLDICEVFTIFRKLAV